MSQTITAKTAQEQIDLFAKTKSARINSIDLLRGFIMIIMALDHTRDFFHTAAWTENPLNLATTTPWLYFTRWITHLCAPNFVFLAGVSIYFQSLRKTKKELSSFLLTRGLWLIIVEILVVNLEFKFDFHFSFFALQVIWAIGISMVILALLIRLPYTAILIIGAVIILGHNSLDYYETNFKQHPAWWYSMLHKPGIYFRHVEFCLNLFHE